MPTGSGHGYAFSNALSTSARLIISPFASRFGDPQNLESSSGPARAGVVSSRRIRNLILVRRADDRAQLLDVC